MRLKCSSFFIRFTPADAGRILEDCHPVRQPEVHPRIRGENLKRPISLLDWLGSPPQTRGESDRIKDPASYMRFTPADAGRILKFPHKIRLF